MERLLESPERSDARREVGLHSVDPGNLRLLAGPADTSICAKLREAIPGHYRVEGRPAPWTATLYAIDDLYVVVLEKILDESAETVEIVPALTLVFDDEYRLLGRRIN